MIEPVPFAQTKFLAMGIPDAKISLKPNFVDPDPGLGAGQGGYALFAGRLSPEKGIKTLLAAWKLLKTNVPLKIVGEGPLREEIKFSAEENPNIQWLGQKQRGEVLELMGEAAFLVFPSALYETFGLSIIEAFSKGTPVIASRLGAAENLVDLNRTGLFFKTDDNDVYNL
jgi:glycosyltransferase involved in cell wall biosynthesis